MNAGTYTATVQAAEMIQSKSGTDGIGIVFEVPDEGTCTYRGWFSEASWEITASQLAQIGCDPAKYDWDMDRLCEELVGRQSTIRVDIEMYDGREQLRVRIGGGGGIGARERMDASRKAAFRDRMKRLAGGGSALDDTPF